MRTKVVIHGAMAREVGRSEWEFEIGYPAEALKAIEANTGKLLPYLYRNMEADYRFTIDGEPVSDMGQLVLGQSKEIHILPVLKGQGGSGGWIAIVGILLIALVIALPGAGVTVAGESATGFTALTTSATLTSTASLFLTIGVGLTLAGVSQLLAPSVKDQSSERQDKPSYLYNGPINTYRQGNPVPFGAGGPFITGSQIISAGLSSIDIVDV